MPEFLKRLCSAFQSTLPYGSDLNAKSSLGFDNYISIHAPLRERQNRVKSCFFKVLFQSTLPCGSDRPEFLGSHSSMIFQSTLPCGSDLPVHPLGQGQPHFNPRSLAGATFDATFFQRGIGNFNPRSLAGATLAKQEFIACLKFQSTLPCGSDKEFAHR